MDVRIVLSRTVARNFLPQAKFADDFYIYAHNLLGRYLGECQCSNLEEVLCIINSI